MELRQIAYDSIIEPEKALRTLIAREPLEDLMASIQNVGLLQPITVIRRDDKFEIIAGHRRYIACGMANLPLIPCLVIEASDQEKDLLTIHENAFREDPNPVDEARWISYMMERHKLTSEQMSNLIGKNSSFVRRRLMLLRADDIILAALEGDHIKLSQAEELMKFPDPDARERYLRFAVENGATIKTIRAWYADYERRKQLPNNREEAMENASAYERSAEHVTCCDLCGTPDSVLPLQLKYLCMDCDSAITRAAGQAMLDKDKQDKKDDIPDDIDPPMVLSNSLPEVDS